MRSDIARRLDKIESSFDARATVLRLEDGTRAVLPIAAAIEGSLAFSRLIYQGELAWRGEAIPEEWIVAFANSRPEPDEGTITKACREPSLSQWGGTDMSSAIEKAALFQQVMTGVERLVDGDAEHAFDGLSAEEECLALIISGRTLMQFCDANEGKHEEWGMGTDSWQRWIANGREIAAEVDSVLGPRLDTWLAAKARA
jgi:hypothetical protein